MQQATPNPPLLDVEALTVRYRARAGLVHAVSDVSFQLGQGETLAIVGESGSGKSTTGLAIMGLLPTDRRTIVHGAIRLTSKSGSVNDVLRLADRERRRVRGNDIAMIFQDPMSSLNPIYSIGSQIVEAVEQHRRVARREAIADALRLLGQLGVPSPDRILASYPHQLSGGMRQRVMIAIALSCRPRALIADEPTTALDVTIQAQILALLKRVQRETAMAVVFITHNLSVVAEVADRIVVMYAGRIVEAGPVREVFKSPRMPYTRSLLRSLPRLGHVPRSGEPLEAIPGNVPSPLALPSGCTFHPRCPHQVAGVCDGLMPGLERCAPNRLVRCARWREID
jgi:peptide/nickel transport system ATP-binding protein